ncbi:SPFH domain-containing protein [Paenibacillus antri]|uniref:SPFH domain-containing protein n=1 Tax=Paenibacillus antri TaxID=2582848 RepID=A0A5R9G2D8_9BACL|nr:SPFH domain-containing protein [Paenibacillus antri]TLS49189.1 SPFH domain-containing protein [Paenibacillus antri]
MKEFGAWKINGFLAVLLGLVVAAVGAYALTLSSFLPVVGVLLLLIAFLLLCSITVVQPNQASVLTFFGEYKGTVREDGFWMVLPFAARQKLSLRVRNFNSAKLKVNDIEGNPIEIAAVIVFKVVETAKASFEVDKYEQFVEIQSETALRHVASKYPYDNFTEDGMSLRGNADEVSAELARELQSRLSVAGVDVLEARLTHLAYSTEIAGAMLQRQQASAIIAARQKIVEGAVGMVKDALEQLERDSGVALDPERKAAMANNLMVAIVSDRAAQPVINTSSLY